MPIPENFKYDVRVRERMLKRGLLTDSELTKHVDALADVTDLVVEVELKQPALVKESERVERVVVARAAARPVVAPVAVRSLEDELNDIDDDEDDDDDDDVKVKAAPKAAPAAVEKAPAAAAEPAPAAAAAAEDEDDDDDDDDEDEEDDEKAESET